MSGNHMIHVHIDTQSPRWSTGHYRFEQHYHFGVSSEQDVQYALARLAELCEELRNPPRDEIPPQDAPSPAQTRVAEGIADFAEEMQKRRPTGD